MIRFLTACKRMAGAGVRSGSQLVPGDSNLKKNRMNGEYAMEMRFFGDKDVLYLGA